ncbi:MAG: ankyrin repeat domain-containing protein, partial [Proteobacteria bacterium]|nr:ankyrin repeat domain-containing protein [Pseudomonadota bacterium]
MQHVPAAFCLGLALLFGAAPAAAQGDSVAEQILFDAVRSDDVELADFALSKGARVDGRDAHGLTPLLIAALFDSPGALELLLERGADPAAARQDGLTALHLAAYKGYHRLVRPLIAAGAPVA